MKSINLGKLKIDTPIFLCPLAGITDYPYRYMVGKFHANLMYSEMLSSLALTHNSKHSLKMLDIANEVANNNVGIQIAGSNLQAMKDAAKMAEDKGACLLDINMGCPAKKVVNGIAGSALMKDEVLAGKIMETVVNAVKIPVSVKMRLGWDLNSINAPTLAKIAENSGISLITVHGRTRNQFYSGESNYLEIAKVKNNVNIPVIANGDIKNEEDMLCALKESKADGIMVGRGTYGKPWLIKQLTHFVTTGNKLKEPSRSEKLEIVLQHYDLILSYYGKEIGKKVARKHLSWYTKGLPNSAEARAKINVLEDVSLVRDSVKSCFYG
ncbi:putative tRNA-dihydrouridine synthase [Candidatus Hepatincola sp. Av]